MNQVKGSTDVSICFTVTLEDGTPVASKFTNARLGYTPGEKEILPALEEALQGAVRGDTRRFILSPEHDPSLKLDLTRLAHVLGHPGERLILDVEIM